MFEKPARFDNFFYVVFFCEGSGDSDVFQMDVPHRAAPRRTFPLPPNCFLN